MKLGKFLGVVLLSMGLIVLVVPAVLPTTIVRQGSGLFQFETRDDGCGSAVYAVFEHPDRHCGEIARDRLLWTTTVGLLLIVAGAFMSAGGEDRQRSRLSSHR